MSESKQLTCEKFGKTMSVIGAVIAILGAILIFAKSAVKNSGGLTGFWKEIYDLNQKLVVKLMVGPSETKEDKYHPVNIQQKEEYEAFCTFIGEFMKEVNEFHQVEASGKIGKPLRKK